MSCTVDSIVELLQTTVVDSILFVVFGAAIVGVFFVLLNLRDLKVEDKAYRNEYRADEALKKFAHQGDTEDDRIDVKRSLRPYDQLRPDVRPAGQPPETAANPLAPASDSSLAMPLKGTPPKSD